MKKGCFTALGILTGLLIASIALIWIRFHPVSVRYRLTVEVHAISERRAVAATIGARQAVAAVGCSGGPGTTALGRDSGRG